MSFCVKYHTQGVYTMTNKIYRSAQGKVVDLGALVLQNENTRAVGNMKVNARGDRIDENGKIIATRGEQVNKSINRTTSNVKSSQPPAPAPARQTIVADTPAAPPAAPAAPAQGLAAAINRANNK
jgi:hypothetical protein